MTTLAQSKCEACNHLTPKVTSEQIAELLKELSDWEVIDGHHLRKRWTLKNFDEVAVKVDALNKLTQETGHNPEVKYGWNYIEIEMWTHAVDGLTRSDFVMAAKIDTLEND